MLWLRVNYVGGTGRLSEVVYHADELRLANRNLELKWRLSEVVFRADELRLANADEFVAGDHLVVACAETDPAVQQELQRAGVNPKRLGEAFKKLRGTRKLRAMKSLGGSEAEAFKTLRAPR
ncbi:hypothetical protein T484DRAFT_1848792 [Baffinella frigidus]|nr:hypothetical protein T484DRAFT_1848792 [Cryptophyta sp. CCMP2293]